MKRIKPHRDIFAPKKMFVLAVIAPVITFYAIFSYGAMIYAFYLSLHEWTVGKPVLFSGLGNYIKTLREDPLFYKALGNTFYYGIVAVPLGAFLALLLAMAINRLGTIGKMIFRALYFTPVVCSLVAISMVWKWLYQSRFGLFNQIIRALGGSRLLWLESPSLAMSAVIIMSIACGLGYTMIIFMAGLQGIPETFYEAATIDGANRWKLFKNITLPLLMPTITFIIVLGTIASLQVFTQMYVLLGAPGSGPLNSTRTIVVHLYDRAFSYYQLGYASATAFVLFVIILVLSIIQLRVLRTKWEY